MKFQTHYVVLSAFVIGFAGFAPASESTVKPNNELLTPVQVRMQQEVCIDFRDTPIDDVLRILAKQADVDIIKSPKVVGNVTATLTDVPLGEALENILASQGFAYVTTTNMIRVLSKDEILETREKIISRVYRVTYADVKIVEETLKKFISQEGSISSNPETSNIIVTDVESKVIAIDSFIGEIDRVTPQIIVEAKIYDVTSKENLDLGVEWQSGTATSYGTVPAGGSLGNNYSTLGNVLHGNPGEGSISSVTNPFATGAFAGTVDKATSTNSLLRFGILNDELNVDAILRASQEDIRARLLANPRIMVLDNQLAQIKIVEEIPYQELTESSGGGSIGTTQFRDVGVELKVTPHVTREGLIRLLLNPKFSTRTGDVVVPGNNNSSPQPIVATRETMTTALIRDTQTVVIGGLKKQDTATQLNKVPLLGDIPLLGELFKFHSESTVNSELVVFITPTIVTEPTLNQKEQEQLKQTDFKSPSSPEPWLGKEDELTMEKQG